MQKALTSQKQLDLTTLELTQKQKQKLMRSLSTSLRLNPWQMVMEVVTCLQMS